MAAIARTHAAIIAAGAFAVAMPVVLLLPGRSAVADMAVTVEPIRTPAPSAPLTAIYGRALFGGKESEQDAELPADAPALVGIVGRIGSDALAMVKGSDGTSRTLQVGESVDGWTLESLAIDAAFFTRGGQRVRVPLPAG